MFYKAIFRGNFQFGSSRSFEKALETFTRQVENLYKGDVLVNPEEIFNEGTYSLSLGRLVIQGTEKSIKNTAYLLETLSQFALAGQAWCWMVNEGQVLFSMHFYPMTDKSSVLSYLDGFQLSKQPGKEQEAIAKFDEAITKFPNHWTALERRGYVQLLMSDFANAEISFNKSLAIFPDQADSNSGLARVYMNRGEWQKAVDCLEAALKNSVPHQPVYWQSRRIKGECYVQLENFEKAYFELNLCVKRQFPTSNSNYAWRKSAMFYFSRVLAEQKKEQEAMDMFREALKTEDALDPVFEGKQLAFYNKMLENSANLPKPTTKKETAAKKKVATA
jgi:tetratricopeptide (TPR) repeat protein